MSGDERAVSYQQDRYYASMNGDWYDIGPGVSHEEACELAFDERDLRPGHTFYTARLIPVPISDLVDLFDADHILDRMQDWLYDNVHEQAYEDLPADADREALTRKLRACLMEWLRGVYPSGFLPTGTVDDVREHRVPREESNDRSRETHRCEPEFKTAKSAPPNT